MSISLMQSVPKRVLLLVSGVLCCSANEDPLALTPPAGWTTCGNLTPAYNRTACPPTQSCATQAWNPANGSWGCCPFPNGVSCSKYTCCPEGSTCKNHGTYGMGGFGVVSVCIPKADNAQHQQQLEDTASEIIPQFPHVIGSEGAGSASIGNVTIGDQVCKTGPPIPYSTSLKNVLIVGDSVSVGYTPWVANALATKALVQHSPWGADGGAEETQFGARCIENLVRAPNGTPLSPDVLLFNWGLHNSLSGNCSKPTPPAPPLPPSPPSGTCTYIANCSMGIGSRAKAPAATKEACCAACKSSSGCAAGVFDYGGNCWLKTAQMVYGGCSFNYSKHNVIACINSAVKPEPPECDPGQSGAPDEYAPYLQQIVDKLKAMPALAKTKLLFAITTPDMCNVGINDIQKELNAQAIEIMHKAGIPTVDLYAAVTGECGPVPQSSCFNAAQCFCPHCYGNNQLGYQWLTNTTLVPAIEKLL